MADQATIAPSTDSDTSPFTVLRDMVRGTARGVSTVGSTPDRLRVSAIATVLIIVAVGAVAWLLTDRLVSETNEVATSTGEVLIATQQVSASFAEADTAAASVHLAGADGNREQRRLYEQATDRATAALEQVARLVGDDERSHTALTDIAARATRYTGLIEAARLASVEDLSGANALLSEATAINRDEISPDVQTIANRARNRFNSQTSSSWYAVALILLAVALATLIVAHVLLSRKFRRLINVPIALAIVVLLALTFAGAQGFFTQQQAFNDAESQAFDAILVSEQIQQNAYRHRSTGTASVLNGRTAGEQLTEIEAALAGSSGLLEQARTEASSPREVAVATEVITRWDRYVVESQRIQQALVQGDDELAERITQGSANAAFNGFNTTVEAALLDNREQFLGQLQRASDSLGSLRGMILFGSLLAAVLTWWGYALRIGEYR